jgi:hypothetical protein
MTGYLHNDNIADFPLTPPICVRFSTVCFRFLLSDDANVPVAFDQDLFDLLKIFAVYSEPDAFLQILFADHCLAHVFVVDLTVEV